MLKYIPCLKRRVKCVIVRDDGRTYEAENQCAVEGYVACPRVILGYRSGDGYHLCMSQHAEARAAELARESMDVPGKAIVYGHYYSCEDCMKALAAVNVNDVEVFNTFPGVEDAES